MIYQSLKPIAAWQSKLTTPVYLTYAIFTGGFASAALISFFDSEGQLPATFSVVAAITLASMKISYWKRASRVISLTPESATGLGKLGKVRQLEAPHATANYINKEMGFKVARKHSEKLRTIVLCMGFLAPVVLGLIGILNDGLSQMMWSIAALLSIGGAVVERWLFFAEAKHAVSAFYSS
jgi:DMSO reductase anchor subunit